jgi:hypothetical protein
LLLLFVHKKKFFLLLSTYSDLFFFSVGGESLFMSAYPANSNVPNLPIRRVAGWLTGALPALAGLQAWQWLAGTGSARAVMAARRV